MSFDPTAQQCRAIEAPAGPVLVVAGPGAGKTYCLVARIDHLIHRLGYAPARICAVTFTNKAAQEIALRLERERQRDGHGQEVTRGTLHALCLVMLRDHASKCGLKPGFGIADEDCQRRLLQRLRVQSVRQGDLLRLFGRHRLQGYPLTEGDRELLGKYQDLLRSKNMVDFDDIVALTGELLRADDGVAVEQCGRWDYVLIDEFQDLNLTQYGIVKRLASVHRNLFAVGDDEQSIYSWAGADPRILDRFREDFGVAAPIVLDQNRRCSRQIFEAARRLIARNPALFDKRIEADRDSVFDVQAYTFDDEAGEAQWIVQDILRDRAECGTAWGDYGVLYRKHTIGHYIERELVRAGIPCRLARGQALLDDDVVAYVISSLRLIRAPDDPLALEAFAHRVLPKQMLEQVRTTAGLDADLLASLRVFARQNSRGDPDTRKAWRFIYHVENLAALGRTHDGLRPLVEELLAQRVGRYRNPLEERHAELTDPALYPGAAALAERLSAASERGATVWLMPDRGVEIALAGLMQSAHLPDVRRLTGPRKMRDDDVVLRPDDAGRGSWPLLVFKALQILQSRDVRDRFLDYVAFDIESTDLDVASCGIVELAAVRVRNGAIVAQFHSLVRPGCPISPGATAVHGYREADLKDQPGFADVWPLLRDFVGQDVLVAHNGQNFDVPVLRRLATGLSGIETLVFFDTLPLAKSLLDESAKLEALAKRFGVAEGRAHHALDDASMLVGVLRHLGMLKVIRARKAALSQALDWLGLALALDQRVNPEPEARLLQELSVPAALGRYSDCLEVYAAERGASPDAPSVEEIIERLGGRRVMERLRAERPAAERYPIAMLRLGALMETSAAPTLGESIDRMLDRVGLSTSEGVERDPHRVSLLTLHSTKGLEFSRVYVVGVEDQQLPGYWALQQNREDEIQEARRLLYVGMTRAKDRLVLTRAELRGGRASGGSLLLHDAGLAPAAMV